MTYTVIPQKMKYKEIQGEDIKHEGKARQMERGKGIAPTL